MKITVKYLQTLRACEEQVELFAATFPKGCYLFRSPNETRDNLLTALKAKLNLAWFAQQLSIRGWDLRCADLSSADLSGANLSSADLSGADLSGANLSSADLRCADLRYANLSSANLSSANLSSAIIALLPGGNYHL